jgi:hypothetical protein
MRMALPYKIIGKGYQVTHYSFHKGYVSDPIKTRRGTVFHNTLSGAYRGARSSKIYIPESCAVRFVNDVIACCQ